MLVQCVGNCYTGDISVWPLCTCIPLHEREYMLFYLLWIVKGHMIW